MPLSEVMFFQVIVYQLMSPEMQTARQGSRHVNHFSKMERTNSLPLRLEENAIAEQLN